MKATRTHVQVPLIRDDVRHSLHKWLRRLIGVGIGMIRDTGRIRGFNTLVPGQRWGQRFQLSRKQGVSSWCLGVLVVNLSRVQACGREHPAGCRPAVKGLHFITPPAAILRLLPLKDRPTP